MKRTLSFPVIPPKEDVLVLLHGTDNLKHQAILMLIYGSGLRVSEVAKLKIKDICSKNMSIRVEQAKHNTNRYTILSQNALEVLRDYFRQVFRQDHLFARMIGFFQDKRVRTLFMSSRFKTPSLNLEINWDLILISLLIL